MLRLIVAACQAAFVLAALKISAAPISGQALPMASPLAASSVEIPNSVETFVTSQPGTGKLTLAGLSSGAAGFLIGGLGGWYVHRAVGCPLTRPDVEGIDTGCDPVGLFVGATIGESLALPLAVHLVNGGRGSYRRAAFVSAAIGAATVFGAYLVEDHWPLPTVVIGTGIFVQLAAAIKIERRGQ